jgi:tetratricopeptide (TPR) repeat protein
VELGTGVVRLLDPDSGREYARLEDPNQDRSAMTFSPDGSQLVTFSGDSNAFHVWDLRALRQELAKLDLDWDLPPYGPSKVDARQPLQIRVDLGELKLSAADQLAMARQVIDQRRRAVEANPNDAPACNNLAWEYLTAPEPLRDWKAALPLAQKAVRLNPGSIYQNTLGLAYYRAGRYREAVEVLEANLRRPDDSGLAWDLYFLAMCYQKLGDPGRARQLLDLGDQLARAHRETVAQYEAELAAFRAEARELLGIGAMKD